VSSATNNAGEARAIIEAAEKWAEPQHLSVEQPEGVEGEGLALLTIPKGVEVKDFSRELDLRRDNPRRVKGRATLSTLQSLIDHALRFKDAHSALFCNEAAPELVSVLDYHEGDGGMPRWGEHRGVYRFPLSDEWKAWNSDKLEGMSQADFAEFLEERLGDVIDPFLEKAGDKLDDLGLKLATPAELLTLSRGLSVRSTGKVVNHQNLSTGEVQLQYDETHTDAGGAPLRVPGGFVIAIPVFQRGPKYKLSVRLRYRVRQGDVTWTLQVHRADLAFRDCLEEACNEAQKQTGLPLFYGSPE